MNIKMSKSQWEEIGLAAGWLRKNASADGFELEKEANLGRWFKEKWVDISRKDGDGKHPPCGRSDSSSGAYPKCRPSKKVSKKTPSTSRGMSSEDKRRATEQKRRAESKPREGKKPHMTSHHKLKKKSSGGDGDS